MMIGFTRPMALVLWLGLLTAAPPAWPQENAEEPRPSQADFLIEALWHGEPRIRQNAVVRLSALAEKPYAPLVQVLATGDRFQAATAAIVLRNLKAENEPIPTETQAALYEILRNPATEVWRWNITATLLAGNPISRAVAASTYSDGEAAPIRRETGIAEASLKDHIDLWTWGVNHPSPLVQLPSLRALQKTGEQGKPAQAAVKSLLHRRRAPLTSIVLKPELVTDGLIGMEQPLPAYDPLVILETLVAIKADPPILVQPLMQLTQEGNQYVRLDAAAMLGKLDAAKLETDPQPHAAKVLTELAMLPWGKVRMEAVRELGNIGEPSAVVVEDLIQLLQDRDDRVRIQAAIALGKMGTAATPALPALRTALRYAKLDTQEAAAAIETAIQNIEMSGTEKMI